MSTFNTEVWDPMLLSTSGALHQSQTVNRRNAANATSNPNSASSANTNSSNPTNANSMDNSASGNIASMDGGHHSMSNVLNMSVGNVNGLASSVSKDLAELSMSGKRSTSSPTSPTLGSKKTGVMYRIFHLGDSTPPEHHDEDGFDSHRASHASNSLWGRSRRSFSGSEADSDENDSDDSMSTSRKSHNSGKLGRKSSIGETMDHFLKRAGSAPFRQKPLNQQQAVGQVPMQQSTSQSGSSDGQKDRMKRQPSKKGIFSVGAGEDSSDFESDLEESVQRKPTRTNLFKDLLQGTRPRKPSNSSKTTPPPLTSPLLNFGHDIYHGEPPSPVGSDHVAVAETKYESHNIFKDLLSPRSKKPQPLPTTSSQDASYRSSASSSTSSMSKAQPHLQDLETHGSLSPNSSMVLPGSLYIPPPATIGMERKSSTASLARSGSSEVSLTEKYGKTEDVLGRGAYAIVKLCCPINSKEKYAVKEFRKRHKDESQKEYVKKLVAEFCISSSLEHENVVKTVDLIQDSKKQWCVVMEYCAGGDLFGRIQNGTLKSYAEMNCFFMQLVRGVHFLHSVGVSHRDLKPENLLLDGTGRILKITDFGVSQVFRDPFGTVCKKTRGIAGSGPYIAPEEFVNIEYDSEPVDVWAIGVIFFVMLSNSILWKTAIITDSRYKTFLDSITRFAPFEKLQPGPKEMLYKLLQPDPKLRIKLPDILVDDWCKSIGVCTSKNSNSVDHIHESTK